MKSKSNESQIGCKAIIKGGEIKEGCGCSRTKPWGKKYPESVYEEVGIPDVNKKLVRTPEGQHLKRVTKAGYFPAKKVSEVKLGDILIFPYGGREEVLEIRETTLHLILTVKCQRSSEIKTRRFYNKEGWVAVNKIR